MARSAFLLFFALWAVPQNYMGFYNTPFPAEFQYILSLIIVICFIGILLDGLRLKEGRLKAVGISFAKTIAAFSAALMAWHYVVQATSGGDFKIMWISMALIQPAIAILGLALLMPGKREPVSALPAAHS